MMPTVSRTGRGFRLSETLPTPSPAAPIIRAAAVQSNPSDANLVTQARSFPNQGVVNCCVSCALGCAMEIIHPDWPALSPLFHYYVSRVVNHQGGSSGALTLDDALTTLTQQGICQHSIHNVDQGQAYTDAEAAIQPSTAAFSDAATRTIPFEGFLFKYVQLNGPSWVTAIRSELQKMRPVAVGFRLPQGYPNGFLDSRFEWTDPTSPAISTTGHCVLVTGYSDTRRALRVRDSQGAGLFDNGGWWMGYSLADNGVIQDACSLIP